MFKKVILGIVALFVLLGVGFTFYINPILEAFRPRIAAAIASALGKEVTLGQIEVSYLPVAIQIDDVSLKDAEKAASLGSLRLKTSIFELLRGSISVKELLLDELSLSITREKDGSLVVGGLPLLPSKTPQETSTKKTQKASGSSINFLVEGANINDANIVLLDKTLKPAQRVSLTNFHAELNNFDAQDMNGTFSLATLINGAIEAKLDAKGELKGLNTESNLPAVSAEVELKNFALEQALTLGRALGTEIKGLEAQKTIDVTLSVNGDGKNFEVKSGLDATPALLVFQQLFKKSSDTSFTVAGQTTVDTTNLSIPAVKVQIQLGANDIELRTTPSGDRFKTELLLADFDIAELVKLIPLAGAYGATGKLSSDVSVHVGAKDFKPSNLGGQLTLKSLGAKYQLTPQSKPIVISNLNGKVFLSDDAVNLKQTSFSVQDQRIVLDATVKDPLKKALAAIALEAPELRFKPFLEALQINSPQLAGDFLQTTDIKATYAVSSGEGDVAFSVAQAVLSGIPLEQMNIKARLNPKWVTLDPSSIRLLDGQVNVKGRFGLQGKKLIALKVGGAGVDLGKLTKAFIKSERFYLSGKVENMKLAIVAEGQDPLPSLQGPVDLAVGKGAIEGFNLFGKTLLGMGVIPGLGSAISSYVPEEHRALLEADNTAYDSLVLKGKLGGGEFSILTAQLTHPLYLVSAKGTYQLNAQGMKLDAEMRLTKAIADKMVLSEPKLKLLQDSNGQIVIPIVISQRDGGSIRVLPDTEDLAKRALKSTAKEAASRAIDRLAPGAGKMLEGLF